MNKKQNWWVSGCVAPKAGELIYYHAAESFLDSSSTQNPKLTPPPAKMRGKKMCDLRMKRQKRQPKPFFSHKPPGRERAAGR